MANAGARLILAPDWKTVTQRRPTEREMESMRFAWEVVAASRSGSQQIGIWPILRVYA